VVNNYNGGRCDARAVAPVSATFGPQPRIDLLRITCSTYIAKGIGHSFKQTKLYIITLRIIRVETTLNRNALTPQAGITHKQASLDEISQPSKRLEDKKSGHEEGITV
jgi:hypothetical protein